MSKRKSFTFDEHSLLENGNLIGIGHLSSTTSPHSTSPKKSKTSPGIRRYKSSLICVVCGGDAHGYNFDAISCESCKAFFRRNALRLPGKFKCRGDGHCDVTVTVTKRCKKCRLDKCFQSGMRKEWILSEKEKEEKRSKIQENRRLKQIQDNQQNRPSTVTKQDSSTDDDDLSIDFLTFLTQSFLTDFEWFQIQSIQNSYTSAVQLNQISGIATYPSIQAIFTTTDLFRVPLYISSMRLISFFKQINEFQQMSADDQVYLVKSNLIMICFFHSMFLYDGKTNTYHESDTTDPIYSGDDWNKTLNEQFHIELHRLRNEFFDLFQSNDAVIKLVFLILIFTDRLTWNQSLNNGKINTNTSVRFNAQAVYAELVYKYFLHQYGAPKAPMLFAQCISKLMKLQQLIDEVRSNILECVDLSQLSPLMESLLL